MAWFCVSVRQMAFVDAAPAVSAVVCRCTLGLYGWRLVSTHAGGMVRYPGDVVTFSLSLSSFGRTMCSSSVPDCCGRALR